MLNLSKETINKLAEKYIENSLGVSDKIRIEELESEVQALEIKVEELTETNLDITEELTKLSQVREVNVKLLKDIAESENQNKIIVNLNEQVNHELNKAKIELNNLKHDNDGLVVANSILGSKAESYDEMKEAYDDLSVHFTSIKKELVAAEELIHELTEELDKSKEKKLADQKRS